MTFIDYLKSRNIDNNTPGARGIIFVTVNAIKPDIEYREASLLFADIPTLRDMFEGLWYGYETELDRQNHERENREPENVYTITKKVIADLMRNRRRK